MHMDHLVVFHKHGIKRCSSSRLQSGAGDFHGFLSKHIPTFDVLKTRDSPEPITALTFVLLHLRHTVLLLM